MICVSICSPSLFEVQQSSVYQRTLAIRSFGSIHLTTLHSTSKTYAHSAAEPSQNAGVKPGKTHTAYLKGFPFGTPKVNCLALCVCSTHTYNSHAVKHTRTIKVNRWRCRGKGPLWFDLGKLISHLP